MPKIDENYRCPISQKKIQKIVDPVLTPSGHIYERANLVAWIISSGGKDPLDVQKDLTVGMLIEGFAVREIVKKYEKDVKGLKDGMGDMLQVLEALNKQNKLLKKQLVLATWKEHGQDIDKKLKKGSSETREDELKKYKEKVLKSTDDEELETAVKDTKTLKSEDIAKRRYFNFKWLGNSETTRVASEFQDKVTASKGWSNV